MQGHSKPCKITIHPVGIGLMGANMDLINTNPHIYIIITQTKNHMAHAHPHLCKHTHCTALVGVL